MAIGALHEKLKQQTLCLHDTSLHTQRTPTFALQQCNFAIQSLATESPLGISIVVTLTSCVLFSAFEMMQDNLESALYLLGNGSRILGDWKTTAHTSSTLSERELMEDSLLPIFLRFSESSDIANPVLSRFPASSLSSPSGIEEQRTMDQATPQKFFSLTHALVCLHHILDRIFVEISLTQSDNLNSKSRRFERHTLLLEDWNRSLQVFLRQCHMEMREAHCRRLCLIELQYLTAKIFHAALSFKDEMIYDDYRESFDRILVLCRSVVELESIGSGSSVPQMAFSFDLGIIMPLYFTATKCRDPALRRDALHMLNHFPRREGIWLSWVTGCVAEQIISIEEMDLNLPKTCHHVPLDNRVQLLEMHYDPCPARPRDESILFKPVLRLKWRSGSSAQNSGGEQFHQRTIRLPATTDSRPGQRPYRVVIPLGPQDSQWKLLLGKKTFHSPI